jgi:ABC-type glutathione transport system ATPase component
VLELRQLRVQYPGAEHPTLDGLDLTLHPGERLALVGPSGCGKSTVARAVLQLLPPGSSCEGELELTGQDPRRLGRAELRRLRGGAVGLVFQDPMTRLNPLLTIGEHLRDTLAAHHFEAGERSRQRQRARELLRAKRCERQLPVAAERQRVRRRGGEPATRDTHRACLGANVQIGCARRLAGGERTRWQYEDDCLWCEKVQGRRPLKRNAELGATVHGDATPRQARLNQRVEPERLVLQ